MEHLTVNLAKRTLCLEGTRKYWWKIKHKSSSSSDDATDTRIWYTDSKKHGYVDDEKLKIDAIRNMEEKQGGEPLDWVPAEHRVKTLKKLARFNKLVDRAEKEHRKQEPPKHKSASDDPTEQEGHGRPKKEGGQSRKPPSFERIAENKLKSGRFIWHRNKDGRWFRIQSLDSKKGKPVAKQYWGTLDQRLSELGDSIRDKNPNTSSKRKNPKRPAFAERNKHGGLIIHSLANSNYYTRFDIGKSRKYPRGFTFRMNRGKFYIQETLDRESLAALEKEISWVLRS
jgi:hypothetical protein